ncbi:unnamed protein product [Adineta ricciae]|uniref:Uncharacterized protein n=1 Tax=Adineta ricciae TaxID=249248 RepID=A0A816E9E8_ADIRI|nr:unnamed protein product [Adineta ricciae]CAF1643786.1 unnamed protein product [Adineta ricciae]
MEVTTVYISSRGFSCKGESIEDPKLVKKLLELSDRRTEHLLGLLPLVPGIPVILTQNIAIELVLINEMNGIFRQIVYEEDSVSTDSISETFPCGTRYIRKPLRALPLVPAYAITTHKNQGQTFNNVVIDLKLPSRTDDIAAIHVPLSRVKRLTDLIILRHFDYKTLLMKPIKPQVNETERLDKLYTETQ